MLYNILYYRIVPLTMNERRRFFETLLQCLYQLWVGCVCLPAGWQEMCAAVYVLSTVTGYVLTSALLLKCPTLVHRRKRETFLSRHISHRGGGNTSDFRIFSLKIPLKQKVAWQFIVSIVIIQEVILCMMSLLYVVTIIKWFSVSEVIWSTLSSH